MYRGKTEGLLSKRIKVISKDGHSAEGECVEVKDEDTFLFKIDDGITLKIILDEVVVEIL